MGEILFDNCLIQAPDGMNLSRCSLKKLQWYLDHGLADKVEDNPPTIKLRFEPSGRAGMSDPLLLDGKPNLCVVCGVDEDLTRHHIIPYSFIRYMDIEYKVDILKDIFPLCRPCHNEYEKKSFEKRQEFAQRYNIPMFGIETNEIATVRKAMGAAHALLLDGEKIPEDRKRILTKRVTGFLKKDHLTDEDLMYVKKYKIKERGDYKNFSKAVAEMVEDYNEFAKEWRTHFVETMQPKHMPETWKIDRKTKNVWVPPRILKQKKI